MIAPWWVPLVRGHEDGGPGRAGAGPAERDRPGGGVAVRVAGVGEDVAERDACRGHRGQHGDQGADRVCRHEERRARRASSGRPPPSSGIMTAADR